MWISFFLRALFLFALLSPSLAAEGIEHTVPVVQNMDEFERAIEPNPGIFLAFFGRQDRKVPDEFAVISRMFQGIINTVVVQTDTPGGEEIADAFGVSTRSLPSLYWFLEDKNRPQKVNIPIQIEEMTNEILNTIVSVMTQRAEAMGIGIDGKVKTEKTNEDPKKKKKEKKDAATVYVTGDEEWEQKVLLNPEVSMVAFTAPWCGHCKLLKPEWDEAAQKIQGEGAQMVWVDATDSANEALASQFNVKGFPSIYIFPGGAPKNPTSARQYPGDRKASDMVKYALMEVDETGVPREIQELVSQDVLNQECKGKNKICVISALPHILDAGAEGRNRHKELLTRVSKTFRGGSYSFVWFEGGSQPDLEEQMELTFGYPAMVAYSMEKNAFAVLHGSFSERSMSKFLHGVTSGRVPVGKLKSGKVPNIVTVEPWDGKDAEPPEEEFSLDDIMGDSDDDEPAKNAGAEQTESGGDEL